MGRLWTPPTVEREHLDSTEQYRAEVAQALEEKPGPIAAEWNNALSKIDPRLRMVKAKESAHCFGVTPGYWHIMMTADGAPPMLMPIMGENGVYAEPSHRTLDWLRASDLQNPQVIRDRDAAMQRVIDQREKDKAGLRDEVTEEAEERWAAATRTQVSMNRDAAWSQNASGQRAAKAAKRSKHGV